MVLIRNLLIIILTVLIPVALFETYLRIDGRYSNLVSTELYGANTIWTRYPSETRTMKHPDKGLNIEIKYNQYGARGETIPPIEQGDTAIGFFGDSFTENLRIENRFSFNSFLSELSEDNTFINFGVDGYGTAQSFQRWLNIKDSLNLDMVVYVFCANDLRNTYEAQIFDRKLLAQGKIKNIVPNQVPLLIALANSFHITYMVIEAYFKARAIYFRGSELKTTLFNARLADKFSEGWEGHRQKFHDEYADILLKEYLGNNPSKETLETVQHLLQIVKKWQEMVEMEGGKFVIAVLPREVGVAASKKLFLNQEIIQLKNTLEIEQLRSLPWHFSKDDHWNEYGNLAGAISFREHFANQNGMDFDPVTNEWIEDKKSKILDYYKN